MILPTAFGKKQGLMSVFPELLDDRLERWPVMRLKLAGIDERNAPAMHPESYRHPFRCVSGSQSHVAEMRHQGFTRFEDLCRLGLHVHGQPYVPAQFIRQNIERSFENA